MGDTWTDEEVIEEILKYFSDIPTPAHAITKLRALMQGKEEAIVMYNQKYRTLVERVEGKLVEKIDSYVELEQYLGSIILPIRKSIRHIYWKSKHPPPPKTLREAMKKAEELYMKHIYATEGQTENNQNQQKTTKIPQQKLPSMKYSSHRNQDNSLTDPGETEEAARSHQNFKVNTEIHLEHEMKKTDSYQGVATHTY